MRKRFNIDLDKKKAYGPRVVGSEFVPSTHPVVDGTDIRFGDNIILRYIVGRNWELDKIVNDLYTHLEWRQINKPIPILRKNSLEMMKRGVVYMHGRTKDLAPLIIVNMARLGEAMDDGIVTPADFVNLHHFYAGYCETNMNLPG